MPDDVKEYRSHLRLMLAMMMAAKTPPEMAAKLVRKETVLAAIIGDARANQIYHELDREIRASGQCPICGVTPPCGSYATT